jgi:hypothetical protein
VADVPTASDAYKWRGKVDFMGYPGDQQQSDGWSPQQPSQSPYGSGQHQPYGPTQPSGMPQGSPDPFSGAGTSFGPSSFEPDAPSDGYGPDAGAHTPQGPGGHENDFSEPPSGKSRKPLIIGAVVAAVVVIGGGTAYAMSSGGSKPAPKHSAAPIAVTTPKATPKPVASAAHLDSRATDPSPLTLKEVFKNKSFKVKGVHYTMTTDHLDKKCANAVHGTKLKKALSTAKCTQLLRATFETANGKLIGTIGIANVTDATAAADVQTASRPKDAYVEALPGTGATKTAGTGLSLTSGVAQGHYVIMSWVQTPSGTKNPKNSDAVAFFQNTTVGSNLSAALRYRDMSGKPFGK